MTTMALISVLGLIAIAILYFFFVGRRAARRAAVVAEVEKEVATKLRRAEEANVALVEQIVAGTSVDRALSEYQQSRGDILPHDRPADAWDWDGDDLDAWKSRELQRRIEQVNRQTILPAISSSLLMVALTVVALTIYYNFMSNQNSVPAFSPATYTPLTPSLPAGLPPAVQPVSPGGDAPPASASPANPAGPTGGSATPGPDDRPPVEGKPATEPKKHSGGSGPDSAPVPTRFRTA